MALENESVFPLSGIQRVGLVIGVLLIVGMAVGLYFWIYRTSYVPLYSNLNEEDAANVLGQLDEMRIPYQLSANGNAILVDSRQAEETRIRLDGGGLAIRGGEGFELFDDADFGMTEYVQKINYQRALQGELARTIIGLSEVRYARVHLVLPEETLFSDADSQPKASVTLVNEAGMFLSASQISGIQQLVASAVDGLGSENVTVLDDRGLVLSQQRPGEDAGPMLVLGSKQEIETYLGLKAARVLDQLYGPGAALVNIDVTLNHDQVQLTREQWHSPEEPGSGGIVAQSRTQREFGTLAEDSRDQAENNLTSEVVEVDYRIDKSVEQIIQGDGEIVRMTVSVMVPVNTSDEQLAAVRQLIATAVGLQESRGDEIGIFAMPDLVQEPTGAGQQVAAGDIQDVSAAVLPAAAPDSLIQSVSERARAPLSQLTGSVPPLVLITGAVAAALVILLLVVGFVLRTPRRAESTLTPDQRQALLAEVRSWLEADEPQPEETDKVTEDS
jgi:flagellar M-ring protein FliF